MTVRVSTTGVAGAVGVVAADDVAAGVARPVVAAVDGAWAAWADEAGSLVVSLSELVGSTRATMPGTPQHNRNSAAALMSAILPLDGLDRAGAWFQLVAAGNCVVGYGGTWPSCPACGW
ncbi:hypothetical protein A6A27_25605 [Micromonospora sp. CB01531]|nr:hypothetical protein A6A27_25605 [Micromonospora sp. CB01531]